MKLVRRMVLALLLLIPITIALSGCWNRAELNTLAIVMGVAVDQAEEDKVRLTVQIAIPDRLGPESSSGSTESAVWIVSSTGYTVFDAVRNFVMQSGRKLFWSHNKIIVISEEVAHQGIGGVVDFFDRDAEPRRTAKVLIAKAVSAKEIIEAKHEMEKIPANAIQQLVGSYTVVGTTVESDLHQVLTDLSLAGVQSVITRIELIDEQQEEGQPAQQGNTRVRVTGAAAFKKDKLVGWLNRPETRGYNWIAGDVVSGIIIVKSPLQEERNVGLEIIRASSSVVPQLVHGQLRMQVEIEMESNLGDQLSTVDLATAEQITVLEKRQATVIENETRAVLHKAQQELNSDIFGFGQIVRRRFPQLWREIGEQWDDIFPNLPVDISVKSSIRRTGLASGTVKAQ